MKESANKYLPAYLALLFGALSFVYDSQALDPVLMPRLTIWALALVFPVAYMFFKPLGGVSKIQFFRSPLSWPFIGLWASGIIGLFFTPLLAGSLFYVLRDGAFLLFLLVLIKIDWQNPQPFFLIASAMTFVSLVLAFFSFQELWAAQKFWPGPELLKELNLRMGHPNLLASALVFILPFAFYTLVKGRILLKIAALLSILGSLTLVMFSGSRSAMLAFLVMTSLVLLLKTRTIPKILSRLLQRKVMITGGILIMLLASFWYVNLNGQENHRNEPLYFNLTGGLKGDKGFSVNERLQLWAATLNMIRDHSSLGIGSGQWKVLFPAYGSGSYRARQGQTQFQRPHNDFLWIWAERGLPGLISYLAMWVAALYCGIRLLRKSSPQQVHFIARLLLGVLAAYFTVALVSFPDERTFHRSVLFLAAGILIALYLKQKGKPTPKPNRWFPLVGILLLGCTAFAGYQRWQGERLTREIINARNSGNWVSVLQKSSQAQQLYFYPLSPTSIPVSFYKGLAHLNLKELPKAEEQFLNAYAVHPYNLLVINNLANIFLLQEKQPEAIRFYKKAIEVSPYYRDGILNLTAAYFNNNQTEAAYKILCSKIAAFHQEGTQRYEQYALTVIKAYRKEISTELTSSEIADALLNINDKKLLKFHYEAAYDKQPISKMRKLLTSYARKSLE